MQSAFDGLRVADLSTRLSAAFAGRLFADYGADVVLVEPPEGHPLRSEPPFLDDQAGPERSVLHAYVNWNKRSLRRDAAAISDVIAWADVVITSEPLGDLDLTALRSDAVHLSITAHGLEGELAGARGNNLTASARSAWAHINAYAEEPPLQLPSRQAGYVGGLAGFVAASAALWRRADAPAPQRVDVSELEALAVTCQPWGLAAIYEARPYSQGPAGGRRRGEPGSLYQARDGKINFGFGDWHNWPQAMDLLNLPDQGAREELIPHGGRYAHDMSAVQAGTARELVEIERWPLFHSLAKLRCIAGCLQSVDELVENEQLNDRGLFVETQIGGRTLRAPGPPGQIEPLLWSQRTSAPRAGEHTDSVVAELAAPPVAAATPRGTGPAGPLDGVRVLAFTQAWSGTLATQLLGLLGAEVVQIEALQRPCIWRTVRPTVPRAIANEERTQHPLNTQGLFNAVNLNKLGLTLNLNTDEGLEIFWRLAPKFDMVVENFRPGVLDRWGITIESLSAVKPDAILASISGYGVTGPYSTYPANGATTEPMSGFSSIHGYEGDEGMNSGGLYPDPVSGYTMAGALLAALHRRDRVGGPQRLDLSMIESVAVVVGDAVAEFDATGCVPRPLGNRDRRQAPHNIYPARDERWLAIAAERDEDWRTLAGLIGRPGLADDARFASAEARKVNEDELDALIGAWSRGQDALEAERLLIGAGLIAARVATYGDLYAAPNADFVRSGFVQHVDHPEVGRSWLAGAPWRLSGAVDTALRPSPCLGQHTEQVLADELGIGPDQYAALVAARICGTLDEVAPVRGSSRRNIDGSK